MRLPSWSDGPLTVMVNEPDERLPAASSAAQVTSVEPSGNWLPELWSHEIDATATLSLAVTVKLTNAPAELLALTEKLLGTTMLGASMSVTVTDCSDDALFPDASRAVHVITVTPTRYADPTAPPSSRTVKTSTPGQLSDTSGLPTITDANPVPLSLLTEILADDITDGASLSATLTTCAATVARPSASVAVQTMLVGPFG